MFVISRDLPVSSRYSSRLHLGALLTVLSKLNWMSSNELTRGEIIQSHFIISSSKFYIHILWQLLDSRIASFNFKMSLWYKGEKQKNALETTETFLMNQFEISIFEKDGWNLSKSPKQPSSWLRIRDCLYETIYIS